MQSGRRKNSSAHQALPNRAYGALPLHHPITRSLTPRRTGHGAGLTHRISFPPLQDGNVRDTLGGCRPGRGPAYTAGRGDAAKPVASGVGCLEGLRIVPRIARPADAGQRGCPRSRQRAPQAGRPAPGRRTGRRSRRVQGGTPEITIIQPERAMARAPGPPPCPRRQTRLPVITAPRGDPQDQALPARHPDSDHPKSRSRPGPQQVTLAAPDQGCRPAAARRRLLGVRPPGRAVELPARRWHQPASLHLQLRSPHHSRHRGGVRDGMGPGDTARGVQGRLEKRMAFAEPLTDG